MNDKSIFDRVVIESDDNELSALLAMWLGDAGYETANDGDGVRIIDTETRGEGSRDPEALYLVYSKGNRKNELLRPFTHTELMSAVRAAGLGGNAGELVCDPSSRRVLYRGDSASLTFKEYAIMKLLCERGADGASRDEIAAIARRSGGERETNAADVYICHLRRKLKTLTGDPMIKTLRGRGFTLSR